MALDLSKFERRHDFELTTEVLGVIRCGTLKLNMITTMGDALNKPELEAVQISRQMLQMVCRSGSDAGDDSSVSDAGLTEEEIQQVTTAEVEAFAQSFVAHNDWLLHTYGEGSRQDKTNENGDKVVSYTPEMIDFPQAKDESNSHYLVRVLRRYLDKQNKRLKDMLSSASGLAASTIGAQYKKLQDSLSGQFAAGLFNNSAVEAMRRNLSMSDQLQDTIKAFKKSSVDRAAFHVPIDPDWSKITPVRLPESPLLETNRQLGAMLEQMGEIRPLVAQSAELIGNMNDTALKMQASFMINARSTQRWTLVAIVIAGMSFVVSSFFSWLSYSDGKKQAEQGNAQIKILQGEVKTLLASQEKDRDIFLNTLRQMRQPLPPVAAKRTLLSVQPPAGQGSKAKATP